MNENQLAMALLDIVAQSELAQKQGFELKILENKIMLSRADTSYICTIEQQT